MLSNNYVLFVARFVVGIVFIIASIDKIAAADAFAASVHAYELVPDFLVNAAALVIPWLELLCGIFLIVGFKVRASALVILILLVVFTSAMAIALMRGLTIDCGCFGKEHASPVSWIKVLEDIGLALLSIYVFFRSGGPQAELAADS